MIEITAFKAKGENTLLVSVKDEYRSAVFEFYYNDDPDIPSVKWDQVFEENFFNRPFDAKPLLRNVMNYFRKKEFSMPLRIDGELKI